MAISKASQVSLAGPTKPIPANLVFRDKSTINISRFQTWYFLSDTLNCVAILP